MKIATNFYMYFPSKVTALMDDFRRGRLNFNSIKDAWGTKEKALAMEQLSCNDPVSEDEKPGKYRLTIELKRIG